MYDAMYDGVKCTVEDHINTHSHTMSKYHYSYSPAPVQNLLWRCSNGWQDENHVRVSLPVPSLHHHYYCSQYYYLHDVVQYHF